MLSSRVSPFEYWYFRLRYPHYLPFLEMGYGIAGRYFKNKKFWTAHLDLTKQFVIDAISSLPQGSSVAVLGSGRLLDIDVEKLCLDNHSIHLFDADAGAMHYAKKALKCKNIFFHLADVSPLHSQWQKNLRAWKNGSDHSIESFGRVVSNKEMNCQSALSLNKFDSVISLNLLSQIPLYWKSSCESVLNRVITSEKEAESYLKIIGESSLVLQEQHLQLLKFNAKKQILLVVDKYWHNYHIDKAPWETEDAIAVEIKDKFSDFRLNKADSWLWHIVPAGFESKHEGALHEVNAYDFLKS